MLIMVTDLYTVPYNRFLTAQNKDGYDLIHTEHI